MHNERSPKECEQQIHNTVSIRTYSVSLPCLPFCEGLLRTSAAINSSFLPFAPFLLHQMDLPPAHLPVNTRSWKWKQIVCRSSRAATTFSCSVLLCCCEAKFVRKSTHSHHHRTTTNKKIRKKEGETAVLSSSQYSKYH